MFVVMPNNDLYLLQDLYVQNILSADPVNRLVIEIFLKVDFAKLQFAAPWSKDADSEQSS